MSLRQYLLILGARHWLIWLVAALCAGGAFAICKVLPKQYAATASVLVDVRSPDPVQGQQNVAVLSPGYMATQVDIVSSDRVAQQVVRLIGLDKSADAQAKWKTEGKGLGTIEQYYAQTLKKYLDVKPARESNLINIEFTSPDPVFAAQVANGFAKAYIETNVALKVDPAHDYAAWFDARIRQLREQLEQAQARLSAYQRETGIISTDERLDVETARLNELNAQLTQVQGQHSDTNSRERQANDQMETSPDVLQSPVIQNLRADVARAEAKLDELGRQLGANHPQFQRSSAELQTLKAKLAGEMQRAASSVGAANAVNRQREQEIRAALEAQKRRALELRQQRDEMAVRQREVESAQRAYDLVAQRLSQSSLESQAQQTNIAVLSEAQPPTEAARPRVLLTTVLAGVAGLLLGICAALLVELARPRLRGEDDVAQSLALPLLATLPAGRARWRRREESFPEVSAA